MLHSHDPDLQIHTLPNGLTIYFKPNKYPKKRVYMELVVSVGAANEPHAINGISHFIEHMAFNTTLHYKQGQVFQELKEAGVGQGHHANAYTGFNRTVYHFYVPAKAQILTKALTFLGEFAFHQAFLPEEVDKERSVILEELRRAQEKDYTYYTGMLSHVFPQETTLGRNTVLGNTESLAGLSSTVLKEFYHRHYVPGNMALVIVGDTTLEALLPTIHTVFGGIPAAPVPITPPVHPQEFSAPTPYVFSHKDYTEYYCGIVFGRPSLQNHTKEERTRLFQYVLLQWILQERFLDLLQPEPRISAMGVSQDAMNFLPTVLLFAYVYSHGNSLYKGVQMLLETIHHMNHLGPSPEELEHAQRKAQEYITTSIKESHKTAHQTYGQSIQQAHLGNYLYITPKEDLEFFAEVITRTTPEDIRAVSQYFLTLETNPLLSFTVPDSTWQPDRILALYDKVRSTPPRKRSHSSTETLELQLPPIPKAAITSTEALPELEATRYMLSNGLEVFVKHTDWEPDTIYCSLTAMGGQLYETPDTKGLSDAYISSFLRGGSTTYTYRQLQQFLSPKKIHMSIDKWDALGLLLSITAAPHTIQEALALTTHHLLHPGFRAPDTIIAVRETAQSLQQQETSKEFAAERHLTPLVYGDHPVGYTPTAKELRRRSIAELQAFHQYAFPTHGTKIVLVGNLSTIDVEQLLSTTLATLPASHGRLPANIRHLSPPSTTHRKVLRKNAEAKTLVRMVFPAPSASDSCFPAFSLYTEMLTELLEERIREELGGTYSIYAHNGASAFFDHGTLEITFECSPDRYKELCDEVLQLLRRAGTLMTPKHLERARKPILSWFEELKEENDLWLRVGRYMALGRPFNWLFTHMDCLKKVTLSEVVAVAEGYHHPEVPAQVVVVRPYLPPSPQA